MEHLGFKGGRLLEPSAGIGNFVGAMPAHLRGNSRWTMVELDPITAGIAKALYPSADVRNMGFEKAHVPDNYFDAAISNVPFGNYPVYDKEYPDVSTKSIHNYFFDKSLDKVRPGGLVAFITSRYTMDGYNAELRKHLSGKADLLGAVRLPDAAFQSNAGTDVVTDILIFKKRPPNTPYRGETFLEAAYQNFGKTKKGGWIYAYENEYFRRHPDMVLGVPAEGTMYHGDGLTYHPKDTDKPLGKQIKEALSKIEGRMEYPARRTPEQVRAEIQRAEANGKVGALSKKDGKIYKKQPDGTLTEVAPPKSKKAAEDFTERAASIISLRDAARALLNFQLNDAKPELIENSRKGLNALYDSHVKKFGPLHSPENQRIIQQDIDSAFICSLEKYDAKTKIAEKADIFSKNTVEPVRTVTHADTVADGLIVSLNETGRVDLRRIAELTGKSGDEARDYLLENGLAYRNRDGDLETAERYLSGNVRAKLREAQALAEGNPEYQRNVEALEKIIPPDVEPENIRVQIGATWVPDETYAEFAAETALGDTARYRKNGISVKRYPLLNEYRVEVTDAYTRDELKSSALNKVKWGTKKRTFMDIFTRLLNNRAMTVTYTQDGATFTDSVATEAARRMAEKIQAEFQDWLFRDSNRRVKMTRIYNDVHNSSVTPRYDGRNLTINGMNPNITLNPHQKDDIWQIVMSPGNTLIDRKVGAGKTFESIGALMKLKEIGAIRKPVIVVPKGLIGQWQQDFLRMFPAAKVLVPGDNFVGPKRKEYIASVATGDFDAVILSYEQFLKIPMSAAYQEAYLKKEIAAWEAALEAEQRAGKKEKSWSVKKIQTSVESYRVKLQKAMEKDKDDNLSLDELGLDFLAVDEIHNFKNLSVRTHLQNVAGINGKPSDRSFELLMKMRYFQDINNGRGLLGATATPVMNSLMEMYVMQEFFQPYALEAAGIHSFDDWLKQFGRVRPEATVSPDGKSVRFKNTLSRLDNVQQLHQMTGQFMTPTEAPLRNIPTMRGGKRIVVKCEPSEEQKAAMRDLAQKLEDVQTHRHKPEGDWNPLKLEGDGRKITYSRRVLDPSLPYEENGKIMRASRIIYKEWKDSADIRGTQILFCDFGVPQKESQSPAKPKKGKSKKGKSKVPENAIDVEWVGEDGTSSADLAEDSDLAENSALSVPENAEAAALAVQEAKEAIAIYHDMKNILVGMGIPADEIAFIHDADDIPKRNALFDAMNEGRVRVLLGSTGKMGVGMNAQKRVVALHHLDAPHRPGDIDQREGRALRQGNINKEVAIYEYATEGTYDVLFFSRLERKQTGIEQIVSRDYTGNSFEFTSDVTSYGEAKAISSGNPLIMEQATLQQQIADLETAQRAHLSERYKNQDLLKETKTAIAADTETAARLRADIAARQDTSGQNFSVTIDGKTISERKAAGETLLKLAGKALKTGNGPEKTKQIGTFAGFDLLTTNGGDLLLRGQGQYRSKVNFQSPAGTVRALENAAQSLDKTLSAVESRLKSNKAALPELEKAIAKPFAQASELDAKRKRSDEIIQTLSDAGKRSGASDGGASGLPATSDFREASGDAWGDLIDSGDGTYHFREASKTPKASKKSGTPSAKADAPKKSAANTGNHPERWTTERVGDSKTKPLSLSEVIAKHRHIMGLNVTTGHIRGARGQYQRKGTGIGSGGIRLKIQNDLPVFLHETGHAIADRYGLAKLLNASGMDDKTRLSKEGQDAVRARIQARQELIGNLDPQFAAQYKEEQLVDEGIAEFFRRYFTNRVQAQSDYPAFHTLLMQTMSGADQAQLLAMADDVNAALSLDTKSAQSSVRRMDDKSPDYRTRAEKIDGVLDRAIQKGVDSLHAVKKLSLMMGSDVHKEFYNANYADARAHFILTEYLTNLEGKPLGPSLKAALQKVDCNNPETYDAFGEYLIVKNAPSWLEDDKRVLANDRKNNIIYCNLREKELLKEHPEFQKAAEALYQFWDALMRTYVVETGLLSEDAYDAMCTKHPYYVPFKRVMDDIKGFRTHRAFANNPNPIKRAQGSGRDIIHPVDSMINATAKFVYQGIHNQVMLDLVTVADAYGLDAAFMERVPDPLAKLTADISGVKASIAERVTNSDLPDQDIELLLNILDEQGDVMTWYSKKNYLPENCIGVRRNGEIEVYKVNDPLLFDALSGMGHSAANKEFLRFATRVTRVVSSMLTGLNRPVRKP